MKKLESVRNRSLDTYIHGNASVSHYIIANLIHNNSIYDKMEIIKQLCGGKNDVQSFLKNIDVIHYVEEVFNYLPNTEIADLEGEITEKLDFFSILPKNIYDSINEKDIQNRAEAIAKKVAKDENHFYQLKQELNYELKSQEEYKLQIKYFESLTPEQKKVLFEQKKAYEISYYKNSIEEEEHAIFRAREMRKALEAWDVSKSQKEFELPNSFGKFSLQRLKSELIENCNEFINMNYSSGHCKAQLQKWETVNDPEAYFAEQLQYTKQNLERSVANVQAIQNPTAKKPK